MIPRLSHELFTLSLHLQALFLQKRIPHKWHFSSHGFPAAEVARGWSR
jgi:hypothetical protein